ncbi:MAG: hypothetical protein AAGF74_00365 [Pseudomonadota bacterium]
MSAADALIGVATIWMTLGAGVAAAFLTVGIDRVDEDAQGAYAFRPLLIPAILMIWPLVLWRWIRVETGTERWQARYTPPRAVHFIVAILMAAAMAVAVIAGLVVRQTWPADVAPVQLEAPE